MQRCNPGHDAFTVTGLGVQPLTTSAPTTYIYSTVAVGIVGITAGVTGTNFANLSLSSVSTPSVTISASPAGTVCAGVGITFTPAPVDGGPTPAYQWFVDGSLIGTGTTFASSVLSTGDFVYAIMTSSAACVSAPTATSNTITVTVTPLPAVQTITGGGAYCAGGTGADIGLSGSESGVTYELFRGPTPVGSAPGTGGPVDFGPFPVVGTYTAVGTAGAGCNTPMSGSVTVSITPGPTAFNVVGGGSYCTGGTGVVIGLSGTDADVTYQLLLGGSPVGLPVSGSGSPIGFGPQTAPGIYTVSATSLLTGCTSTMTGSVTISTIALPTIENVTGGGTFCAGSTGAPVGLDNSQLGVNYQLYNGTTAVGLPMAGTGAALPFGFQTAAGIYTVVATNSSSCSDTMAGSASIIVNPLPNAYIVLGGGGYCTGTAGADIELSGSDLGVNYQLMLGAGLVGASMPGTGSLIDFGPQASAGTYTILATNATTFCTVDMTGSLVVSVNPLPTPFAISGGGTICERVRLELM